MKYLLQIARDGRRTQTRKDGVLWITEDEPEQQLILLCKSTELEDYSDGIDVAKIIERLKIYIRAQQRYSGAYAKRLEALDSNENIKILVQNVGPYGSPDNERVSENLGLYAIDDNGVPLVGYEMAHIEETDDEGKKLGRMNRLYVMERKPRFFLFWNYNCNSIVPPDPFARHCRMVPAEDCAVPESDEKLFRI